MVDLEPAAKDNFEEPNESVCLRVGKDVVPAGGFVGAGGDACVGSWRLVPLVGMDSHIKELLRI